MTESADAYPPLAGELTVRQFAAWCADRHVRPAVFAYREGWLVRDDEWPTHTAQAPDLQDAITLFMSRVDGRR